MGACAYTAQYSRGDFSFIQSRIERLSLEHDFKKVDSFLGGSGWDTVKSMDEYMEHGFPWNTPEDDSPWNTPEDVWIILTRCMFAGHTTGTLKRNITELSYIAHHGWNEYVIMKLQQQKNSSSFTY